MAPPPNSLDPNDIEAKRISIVSSGETGNASVDQRIEQSTASPSNSSDPHDIEAKRIRMVSSGHQRELPSMASLSHTLPTPPLQPTLPTLTQEEGTVPHDRVDSASVDLRDIQSSMRIGISLAVFSFHKVSLHFPAFLSISRGF